MLLSLLSKRTLHDDSRDTYGFTVRPHLIDRYREYADIYKEEENERSQKWKEFLEQQKAYTSSDHSDEEILNHVVSEVKKEQNESVALVGEVDSTERSSTSVEVSRDKIEDNAVVSGEGDDDCSSKKPHSDTKEENVPLKESPITQHKESREVRKWAEIRPSLCSIDNMMSIRVKKQKYAKDDKNIRNKHSELTSVDEAGGQESENEDLFYDNEIPHNDDNDDPSTPESKRADKASQEITDIDDASAPESKRADKTSQEITDSDDDDDASAPESKRADKTSQEPFFPWKQELESLVQGGVPKDLRGEVWQAFVGVRTRRMERYYQDLLDDESVYGDGNKCGKLSADNDKEQHNSKGFDMPDKLLKQIEKDLPRTFPGHPALNENGRNSLRRVLLAYARHNPSVGYCQAMNFFAGLLLLMMPEENAFWALVGIIDDYFEGCFSHEMTESQVDQLVFEDLMRERFPKLVNHLDYLGVEVAWISAPWFLSIFVNMVPWESVLRVWDVMLFEGTRVMLFRTALALMELYGPALLTTKDAGDVITLLQTLTGSTFDSSQLVLTACMGFLSVNEDRLRELREKHRPTILAAAEERAKGGPVLKDPKGLATKLYSFKHDPQSVIVESKSKDGSPVKACSGLVSHPSDMEEFLKSLGADSEANSLPDLQEQVVWMKVELCKMLEEKRSDVLRAEELESALMEIVKQDNRRELSARIEQLEQEVVELRQILSDKNEGETAMLQVLLKVEHEQRITEDARRFAEQEAAAQKHNVRVLQDKLAQMEKRVVMAESMLEATLQYESGQSKALASPRPESPRKLSLLSFGMGWRDRYKAKPSNLGETAGESKVVENKGNTDTDTNGQQP